MSTALVTQPELGAIESTLIRGDLSKLSEAERLSYYNAVCKSLGLNALTQPLAYITLQGKLTLYAKRDATEQLRKIHGVSIERLEKDRQDDLYIVTAYARDASGRTDASTGVVNLKGLSGENLANAIMKGETKAKRRVTLSICGLGLLDETEVDGAQHRPTLVIEAPKQLAAAPDALYIKQVTPAGGGNYARVILSDGRELAASGPQMVAALEQWAQEGIRVEITTRMSKKRGTNELREVIDEARKWVDPSAPIEPKPEPLEGEPVL